MALEAEDVRRFAEVVERVSQMQEKLGMGPVTGVSNATIAVNAGGVGVWLATTACVVMLALSILLTVLYLDVRDDQRITAAHLATIYLLVPDLRKQVEETLKNQRPPTENVK